MFKALCLLSGFVVFASDASARSNIRWQSWNEGGRIYFEGRPTEEESDTVLWVLCKGNGKVQVGLGGQYQLGKGEGDAVSATLRSAGKEARLDGKSRKSKDFEMTAGTELQTIVPVDDGLFAVLTTGKEIQAKSTSFTETWPVRGLAAGIKTFLKACKP